MNILQQLNFLLEQKKFLDFHTLLEKSKNENKINEDLYFKFKGFYNFKLNDFKLAIDFFKKSLNAKESFDVHLNIAVSYSKILENNLSEHHFKKSIQLNNKFEDTYILYSKLLKNLGKDSEAVKLLNQGIKSCNPNNIKLIIELADTQRVMQHYIESIINYTKVLKKNPYNFIILNSLGVCYEFMNESALAEQKYKNAIEINPNYGEALINYGNLLRSLGNSEEALKYFDKCIDLNFNKAQTFRYISILRKFRSTEDKYLKQMSEYEGTQEFQNDAKYELYFAMSKAYEDLKDKKKFGTYLSLANEYKRKSILNEKIEKELGFFDLIKDTFAPETVKKFNPELDGSNIILIIGMPRSGTTLVEQILGSHQNVSAGGELPYFQNILRGNFDFYIKDEFKKDFNEKFENIKNKLGEDYFQRLKEISKNKVVTDKLLFNFFYIGFFFGVFKDIKIISVSRDPLDNCFSIFKNYFVDQINFAYNQKELANYYKSYQGLMSYWNSLFKERIFNLKYEKLIEDQEKTTRDLLDYCNLEWDENCLKFYKSKSSVKTLSTVQVRSPIYKSSIKSWEKYKDYLDDLICEFKN